MRSCSGPSNIDTAILTSPADSQAIERFVRGTLGCGCPDEVFNSIAIERARRPGTCGQYVRLLVGNRLLIYVVEAQDPGQARASISVLAPHGIDERDRLGLNRFRLVVAADYPAQPLAAEPAGSAGATDLDDRAHLHLVASDLVPASLR